MFHKTAKMSVSPIGQFCIILAILYMILSGCASEKEFRHTTTDFGVFGVLSKPIKASLRTPLRSAVMATAYVLASEDFTIVRIELQRDFGAIEAKRGKTKIYCFLNMLTKDLTRIRAKLHNSDLISEKMSNPDTIINEIRFVLQRRVFLDWDHIAENMIRVYTRPSEKSHTAAYLAPGAEVDLYNDFTDPSWSRIKMTTGGFGYVMNRNLKPALLKP